MADIHFACPHCQQHLQIDPSGAGLTATCPQCTQEVTVPLASEGSVSSPTDSTILPRPPSSARPARDHPPPPPRRSDSRPPPRSPLQPRSIDPTQPSARETTFGNDAPMRGLAAAFRAGTIAYCLLGWLLILLVNGLVFLAAMYVSAEVQMSTGVLLLLLNLILFIGLSGVLTGAIAAASTRQEPPHAGANLREFVRRRFLALFGSTLIFVFLWLLLTLAINGVVFLVNESGAVGTFVGALLLVPQLALNAFLAVCLLSGVLVPCAAALESLGPWASVTRLVHLVRTRSGDLLAQTGVTLVYGTILTTLVYGVVALTLGPTLASNGPNLESMLNERIAGQLAFWVKPGTAAARTDHPEGTPYYDLSSPHRPPPAGRQAPPPSGSPVQQAGDWIRVGVLLFLVAGLTTIPWIYWISSFAFYHVLQVMGPQEVSDA